VSRPRLVVHGHFYQPSRLDPATGTVPPDPTAAPARDWNTRIAADCYRPNAELGNYGRISWDLGPTLAGWLEEGDPVAYRGFVEGDGGRHGMAQPFHHSILPLSTLADRRTEIRWGLRDFEWRFGRRPTGVWLPETAVDLETLGLLVDEGVTNTIVAPWQLAGRGLDTRRPYRVDVGGGRSIVVLAYDAGLSTSVSFEIEATSDADRFARERIVPRLSEPMEDDDAATPFALIATDGELYGHHQPYRDLFLQRLVGPADLGFDVSTLADVVAEAGPNARPAAIVERSSWSCHHGVARWETACGCVDDGAWKAPLRAAFDRLAEAIDTRTDEIARALPGAPDPWPTTPHVGFTRWYGRIEGNFHCGVVDRGERRPADQGFARQRHRLLAGGDDCVPDLRRCVQQAACRRLLVRRHYSRDSGSWIQVQPGIDLRLPAGSI